MCFAYRNFQTSSPRTLMRNSFDRKLEGEETRSVEVSSYTRYPNIENHISALNTTFPGIFFRSFGKIS